MRKDFLKLGRQIQNRILDYLTERVITSDNPRSLGKALSGNLQDFWCYRVGDYRIIVRIEESELIIYVVTVGHRREVYDA